MKLLDKVKETLSKIKNIFSKKEQVQLLEEPKQDIERNGFDKLWKEKLQQTETPKDRFKTILNEKGAKLSEVVTDIMYDDIFKNNEEIASISYEDEQRMEKIGNIIERRLDSFEISENGIKSDKLMKLDEKGNVVALSQNIYSEDTIVRKSNTVNGLEYYGDGSHTDYGVVSVEETIKYDPQTRDEMEVSEVIGSKQHRASNDDVVVDPLDDKTFKTSSQIITRRSAENRNIIAQKRIDEKGEVTVEKGTLNNSYSQMLPRDESDFYSQTKEEQENQQENDTERE